MTDTPQQSVILDRDGTIVIDRNYLGDPAGLEFATGAQAGLRRLHSMGCRLFVVSNQSGIGRGLLSREQVDRVNRRLLAMLATEGVTVQGIYYCPHVPEDRCGCRKPKPALLLQAAREHSFDPASAIVIGDKMSDVELGRRVGARSMLIGAPSDAARLDPRREYLISGLEEAADIISSMLLAPTASGLPMS